MITSFFLLSEVQPAKNSIIAAVPGLPAILAQTRYAREFETEADKFAFNLLKQKGRSPEAFASIMEKLSN